MTERSVAHATFVIERTYAAVPWGVFDGFASREAGGRWFIGPDDWLRSDHELDFRVGGREHVSGGPPGGSVHSFDAQFRDIVADQRIVTIYEMHMDDVRISVSVARIDLLDKLGAELR